MIGIVGHMRRGHFGKAETEGSWYQWVLEEDNSKAATHTGMSRSLSSASNLEFRCYWVQNTRRVKELVPLWFGLG